MNKLIQLLFPFFFTGVMHAQSLHIYFDVYKDSFSYKKNGQTAQKTDLRKGDEVILHLVNLNDFLYRAEVTLSGADYEKLNSNDALPIGGIMSIPIDDSTNDNIQNFSFNLGLPSIQLPKEISGRLGLADGSNPEWNNLVEDYKNFLDDIYNQATEISDIEKDIKSKIFSLQSFRFKLSELDKLLANPRLSPYSIKSIYLEYLTSILGIQGGKEYDLDKKFFEQPKIYDIQKLLQDYLKEIGKVENRFKDLSASYGKIDKKVIELKTINAQKIDNAFPVEDQKKIIASNFQNVRRLIDSHYENASKVENILSSYKDISLEEFASAIYLYEAMKEHEFEKTIVLSPKNDISNIEITLIPIDTPTVQGVYAHKLNPLEIIMYGGMKVRASVGLSFARFFNRPQKYFARNQTIVSDDLDPFSSVATSFIHFYRQGKGELSVGGAFGIGLGLNGEGSGLQNFFFGPSLIFGNSQRVNFSAGIMTGKVNRLSEGYKVGDAYGEAIIPTKFVNEFGLFMGLSFNFMNN